MSADGWEVVTDPDSIREGEPLRVLGEAGWEFHREPGDVWLSSDSVPGRRLRVLPDAWLVQVLCQRGQVERRAEPEPHPDDVAFVRRLLNLRESEARYVVQRLAQQRRERGEQ